MPNGDLDWSDLDKLQIKFRISVADKNTLLQLTGDAYFPKINNAIYLNITQTYQI